MYHRRMLDAPRLLTERTRLVVLEPDDAPLISAYYRRNRARLAPLEPERDEAFYRTSSWRARLAGALKEHRAGRAVRFALLPRDGDEMIGAVNLTEIVRGPREACFLGFSIDGAQEGRGLMREALEAALEFAFGPLGLCRVEANHLPENGRSAALLARLGFVREGLARAYLRIAGRRRDHVLTALARPDAPGTEPPSAAGSGDVRDAYAAWAEIYDSAENRTRDLDARVTRDLLAGRRFGAVLELGCGTGKNTAFYASVAERVLALDFSPEMLDRARAKGFGPRVAFATADVARPLPVEAGAFDLVAVNLVLEHVRDLAPVFAECRRTLAPRGLLHLVEFHPFRQYGGGGARYPAADGIRIVDTFIHHVSDFTAAASAAGLRLERLGEWRDGDDGGRPPRLLSLLFAA